MNDKMISKLRAIEIQTVSWCNAGCVVCPWPQIKDSVPRQGMTDDIWNKVLEGIRALNPDIIVPYLNNEPLLDQQLESRIQNIRSISPMAQIELSTNGLLLTEKSAEFLVNHVDVILVSLFGSDETGNNEIMGKGMSYNRIKNNILTLKKAKDDSGSDSSISVIKLINCPFLPHDTVLKDWIFWEDAGINVRYYGFVDRATNAGNFNQRDHTVKPCGCDYNSHNESTCVLYNGDISLCSHDWRKSHILGNLHENSLTDIINGEKYRHLRNMVDGVADSDVDFLCRKCANCKTDPKSHSRSRYSI